MQLGIYNEEAERRQHYSNSKCRRKLQVLFYIRDKIERYHTFYYSTTVGAKTSRNPGEHF
jgi:hypothetical protein